MPETTIEKKYKGWKEKCPKCGKVITGRSKSQVIHWLKIHLVIHLKLEDLIKLVKGG